MRVCFSIQRGGRLRGAAGRGLALGLLIVGACLGAFLAYQQVKKNSQPVAPVMTDADWQQTLLQLQERVNAAAQETGSIAPLIAEIQTLAEQSGLKGPGYQLLGQAWLVTGNYYQAYEAFAESLTHDTGNHQLQMLAGTAAFEIGGVDRSYFERAIGHYERALELKPDDAEARLYLAESMIERKQPGDEEQGLFLLTEALGLDDRLHAAYYRLAGLRMSKNDAHAALEAIQNALARVDAYGDEEEREAYQKYQAYHAKVLMRLRDFDTALRLLLQHPDRHEEPLLGQLATCHAQRGHPERAAAAYEILLLDEDQTLPDAHTVERAAHWWLNARQADKAQRLIKMYAGLPAHAPQKLQSLEKRLSALRAG